jgi:hypothetical protein
MTKEELKNYIKRLHLEKELEDLIFELIDGAKEVNKVLLNTIADIIDQQADFYEKTADILEEEADIYEQTAAELSALDAEEYKERFEVIKKTQEELLDEINKKIEELKLKSTTASSNVDQTEINKIKNTLQQQGNSV